MPAGGWAEPGCERLLPAVEVLPHIARNDDFADDATVLFLFSFWAKAAVVTVSSLSASKGIVCLCVPTAVQYTASGNFGWVTRSL